MKWQWRRKRKQDAPDLSMSMALVHLGLALRAHQEGDLMRAVRHLALAAETISSLIETWTTPEEVTDGSASYDAG